MAPLRTALLITRIHRSRLAGRHDGRIGAVGTPGALCQAPLRDQLTNDAAHVRRLSLAVDAASIGGPATKIGEIIGGDPDRV